MGQRDGTRVKQGQWSLGMLTGYGQPCFLLKVHYRNSHFLIFSRSVAEGGPGVTVADLGRDGMLMLSILRGSASALLTTGVAGLPGQQ
jgi:hypothetical protein